MKHWRPIVFLILLVSIPASAAHWAWAAEAQPFVPAEAPNNEPDRTATSPEQLAMDASQRIGAVQESAGQILTQTESLAKLAKESTDTTDAKARKTATWHATHAATDLITANKQLVALWGPLKGDVEALNQKTIDAQGRDPELAQQMKILVESAATFGPIAAQNVGIHAEKAREQGARCVKNTVDAQEEAEQAQAREKLVQNADLTVANATKARSALSDARKALAAVIDRLGKQAPGGQEIK